MAGSRRTVSPFPSQTLIEEQQRLSERTLQDAQVELARIKVCSSLENLSDMTLMRPCAPALWRMGF